MYLYWEVLLKRSSFLRKEKQGWIQKKAAGEEDHKQIVLITGEKPWSDKNRKFVGLLTSLRGDVLILDPYYGIKTLHVLSYISKKCNIKFLTCQLGNDENQALVKKELARFKKEFKNIKFKIYPKFYEIHDRYIISENLFIIVGHGLKDMGNKECFLIAIPTEDVIEFIKILKDNFNKRWTNSQEIN